MYLKDAVAEILKSVQPLIADGAYQELKSNYDQAIKPDPKVIPNVPPKPQPVNPQVPPKPPPNEKLAQIQQQIETQLGDIADKVENRQGVTTAELEELQRNILSFITNHGAPDASQSYRLRLTLFRHLNNIKTSKADIITLLEKEKFNDIIENEVFQRGLITKALKPILDETQRSKLALATRFRFVKNEIEKQQNDDPEPIQTILNRTPHLSKEALLELSTLVDNNKPEIANLLRTHVNKQ
jgi:hypothetical protein